MKEFEPQQEADRVNRDLIAKIAIASLLIIAVSLGSVVLVMGGVHSSYGTLPPGAPTTIGTVEQTLILGARRGLVTRAEQRKKLEHYEWVDRDAGVARIPIERAIDLVAAGADGGAP